MTLTTPAVHSGHLFRKPRRTRATAPSVLSRTDAEHALYYMELVAQDIRALENALQARITRHKARMSRKLMPRYHQLFSAAQNLKEFADLHRQELTEHEARKYHAFAQGIVRWPTTPPSLVLKDSEEVLIKSITRKKLRKRFLRLRPSLNLEALLTALLSPEGPTLARKLSGKVAVDARELFIVELLQAGENVKHDPAIKENPWSVEKRQQKRKP